MTTYPQATAAPTVLKLGGKEFRCSPLLDADYGEFEQWVQDHAMSIAKRNLEGLSEDQQQKMLDHAFDKCLAINILSSEALTRMTSVEGIAKMLFMSVRQNHPDVTQEFISATLTDVKSMEDTLDALERIAPRAAKKLKSRRKVKRPKRPIPTRRKKKKT